jgi:hypothetical protein
MSGYLTLRAGVFLPPFHPNDEDPLLCISRSDRAVFQCCA